MNKICNSLREIMLKLESLEIIHGLEKMKDRDELMRTLMSIKRILTIEEIDEIHEKIEHRIEVLSQTQADMCEGDSA